MTDETQDPFASFRQSVPPPNVQVGTEGLEKAAEGGIRKKRGRKAKAKPAAEPNGKAAEPQLIMSLSTARAIAGLSEEELEMLFATHAGLHKLGKKSAQRVAMALAATFA